MKKVTAVDHEKELRLFRKMRKWAGKMGAPASVLQDLDKIEDNPHYIHRIFSVGWDKKWKHIMKHVKPLEEAEHINKSVALYKAHTLSAGSTILQEEGEGSSAEECLKLSSEFQACLTAKEKERQFKEMKKKQKSIEANIEGIKRTIEVNDCVYKEVKDEVDDFTRKCVLVDLKEDSIKKEIEKWNETTEVLKLVNLSQIPRNPSLSSANEAMVKQWVERFVGIIKASVDPEVYEQKGDAEHMVNEFIRDLTIPRLQISSKEIVTALTKIVLESRRIMKTAIKENIDDGAFSEYRKGMKKRLKELWTLHTTMVDKTKHMTEAVHQMELEVLDLHEEILEHGFYNDPEEDDVESNGDYFFEYLISATRLAIMILLTRERVATLSQETKRRQLKNKSLQTYGVHKGSAFNLVQYLRDHLRTQASRVKQRAQACHLSVAKSCKQPNHVSLKRISSENMTELLLDQLEEFLSVPPMRSLGSEVLKNETRVRLSRKCDVANGPNHVIVQNISDLLNSKEKFNSLPLPTVETKLLFKCDSAMKENHGEIEKQLTVKRDKITEHLTETNEIHDRFDIILKDWMELPFYDCIPESTEVDGKDFTVWENSD